MERWITINNIPAYEVSDLGRVRNIKTGRIMKTYINEKGYEIVSLRRNGKYTTQKVHKLVAEAFCERYYEEDIYVYHRDRNRSNNIADNLEWRRWPDIVRCGYRRGGRKQTHKMRTIFCRETGRVYESITECSLDMGISKSAISRCVNNSYLSTREGYHFEALD